MNGIVGMEGGRKVGKEKGRGNYAFMHGSRFETVQYLEILSFEIDDYGRELI
jgi:hypothetical protein